MIKINRSTSWPHHRSGWRVCAESLKPYHTPDGILFVDYLEEYLLFGQVIGEPWIGVLHNAIRHPRPFVSQLYGEPADIDLERMLQHEFWKANYPLCRGVLCLSNTSAEFLRPRLGVPVFAALHATGEPDCYFDFDKFVANPVKMVFLIGHWMRNFQAFYDLQTPLKKCMFCVPTTCDYRLLDSIITINSSVERFYRQTDEQYDLLLGQNLVFLNLFDCAACNTVLECIVRNTPVLVNRLPALEEYLGHGYPLFYKTLDEAGKMSADFSRIRAAHEYLVALPKERFSPAYFGRTVAGLIRNAS